LGGGWVGVTWHNFWGGTRKCDTVWQRGEGMGPKSTEKSDIISEWSPGQCTTVVEQHAHRTLPSAATSKHCVRKTSPSDKISELKMHVQFAAGALRRITLGELNSTPHTPSRLMEGRLTAQGWSRTPVWKSLTMGLRETEILPYRECQWSECYSLMPSWTWPPPLPPLVWSCLYPPTPNHPLRSYTDTVM